MAAPALNEETYLPEADGQVAQVHDFMQAHERSGRGPVAPRYFLAGATPGDRVELPAELYGVLRQVVEALQQGLAVTVAPRTLKLTTQQAADLLGVSRPTVVKLLNDGRIPFSGWGPTVESFCPTCLRTGPSAGPSNMLPLRERRWTSAMKRTSMG